MEKKITRDELIALSDTYYKCGDAIDKEKSADMMLNAAGLMLMGQAVLFRYLAQMRAEMN